MPIGLLSILPSIARASRCEASDRYLIISIRIIKYDRDYRWAGTSPSIAGENRRESRPVGGWCAILRRTLSLSPRRSEPRKGGPDDSDAAQYPRRREHSERL